jgi:hypothetical protein
VSNLESPLSGVAKKIGKAHAACEGAMKDGLQHALEAGRLLLDAKSKVKHGDFAAWVEKSCGITSRLSQRYMQIAREYPKLETANASRVADLSFRDALSLVANTSRKMLAVEPERRERVLEAAVESDRSGTLAQRICGEDRRARRRADIERIDKSRASLLTATFPQSWSSRNWMNLVAEISTEPEFTAMQDRIQDLVMHEQSLCTKLDLLRHEIRELRETRDLNINRVARERHGHVVKAGSMSVRRKSDSTDSAESWFAQKVDDDVYEIIAGLNVDNPLSLEVSLRLEVFAKACSRCSDCFVQLTVENAGVPDKPGKIYLVCNWCREHRGKTHCNDCGKPLPNGAEFICADCEGDDEIENAVEELSELGVA